MARVIKDNRDFRGVFTSRTFLGGKGSTSQKNVCLGISSALEVLQQRRGGKKPEWRIIYSLSRGDDDDWKRAKGLAPTSETEGNEPGME